MLLLPPMLSRLACCCRRCYCRCGCYRCLYFHATFTAPDAALSALVALVAAPDHVCMALCKALNARAHDRNVYPTQRTDFLRNIGISGGENTNVANAKAWSRLKAKLLNALVLKKQGFGYRQPNTSSDGKIISRLSNFLISDMKNFTLGVSWLVLPMPRTQNRNGDWLSLRENRLWCAISKLRTLFWLSCATFLPIAPLSFGLKR